MMEMVLGAATLLVVAGLVVFSLLIAVNVALVLTIRSRIPQQMVFSVSDNDEGRAHSREGTAT